MNFRSRSLGILCAVALALSACNGLLGPQEPGTPSLVGNRRVLFIGNSHTYVNDLPRMLQTLARAGGDTALRTAAIAEPNYSLEDHFLVGRGQKALEKSGWEFVVLQQGTSALPESQVYLSDWTAIWAPLIRGAGAEPVMYQIWPLYTQRHLADAALTSYHNAAVRVGGILAPAGDAFTAALDSNFLISVYNADGLHASRRGTYLAALVLLERISGIHPESLPPTIPGANETVATVRELQKAAAKALERTPALPTVVRP